MQTSEAVIDAIDIEVVQPRQVPTVKQSAAEVMTPMAMIDRAVASGADPVTLERLLALQERWEAGQAKKAFDAALASAKGEIPTIIKNREVGYDHKTGEGKTSYRHEDLAEIARTVDPILAKYGLSYRFRTTSNINEPIVVTCILSHRDGHSEENTLMAGKDESGKKNSIQAIGSTITYLQRYTLKAALGLAASNDDDGRQADAGRAINEAELAELNALIGETETDVATFCKVCKVEFLADLPFASFPAALAKLKDKKSRLQKGA